MEQLDQIVELDKMNMSAVIAESGGVFSPEKRKNGLRNEMANGSVFVMQKKNEKLVGYIQFTPIGNDVCYVVSLQIQPEYRNGIVLRSLIRKFASEITKRNIVLLRSSVHECNKLSLRLHDRLGFRVENKVNGRFKLVLKGEQLEKAIIKRSQK